MSEQTKHIEITINGEPQQIVADSTVAHLLTQLALTPERVAIEYNLSILARKFWADTKLQAGDKLEIVHFVGGG